MINVTVGVVNAHSDTLEKENKGVTLIALVVTITILLILAGISIAALTGENGLIKRAGNAKEQTEIAQEKEILQQASVSAMGKSKTGDVEKDNLNTELSKYNEIDTSKTKEVTDGIEVTFKSGRTYTVNAEGDVTQKMPRIYSNEVKAALTEGKYVTYNRELYRVLYDVNSGYDWIEIISVNPLESVILGYTLRNYDTEIPSNTELEKQGYGATAIEKTRWSYNNAIATLNKKAQNYLTNLADRARCVGSNPEEPLNESTEYTYPDEYVNKPTLKDEDNNYTYDKNQMDRLDLSRIHDNTYGSKFWIASRLLWVEGSAVLFGVNRISAGGGTYRDRLGAFASSGSGFEGYSSAGFRPVIRLKDSIKITGGSGTEGSPYTIGL